VNGPKKAKAGDKWEKTYCCNAFCCAAYVHGAGIAKECWTSGNSRKSWEAHGFKYKGTLSVDKLQEGDVLIKDGKHSRLYVGNGRIAEARSEGWDENSIRVVSIKDIAGYYVMRYEGE